MTQKDVSIDGVVQEIDLDRAGADRAAEREPDGECAHLQPGAYDRDPDSEPLRADDHQRVARPGAQRRGEIESRAEAGQQHAGGEQADPDTDRVVGEVLDSADRRQADDKAADEQGVRERPDPDLRAEQPRDRHHDDADDDGRDAERDRRVPGHALVQRVPGREAEPGLEKGDDSEGEQEQAADEDGQPLREAAADPRWRAHHLNLRADATAIRTRAPRRARVCRARLPRSDSRPRRNLFRASGLVPHPLRACREGSFGSLEKREGRRRARVQREQAALVLEKDDRLSGRLQG